MPKYAATTAMPMATHQPAHRRRCGPPREGVAAGEEAAGAVVGADAAGGAWDGSDVMVLSLEAADRVGEAGSRVYPVDRTLSRIRPFSRAYWSRPIDGLWRSRASV